MNEAHFLEIDKALLLLSEARKRAARAATAIEKDGGEAHLVAALRETDARLLELHRRLMQDTYFAVPDEQLSLTSARAGSGSELGAGLSRSRSGRRPGPRLASAR